MSMSSLISTIPSSSQYRYDTVKEFQQKLQLLVDQFSIKKKKYQRRISAIDIAVYSVSGVLAGAGIILSSVTMTAPVVVPICISAVTVLTGIFTGVTKNINVFSTETSRLHTQTYCGIKCVFGGIYVDFHSDKRPRNIQRRIFQYG